MKWNQFRLKTTTEAEDIVSSMLADLGIEGVQIEDKIPLTQQDKEQMFVDILPDIPEDDGVAYLTFYLDPDLDAGTILALCIRALRKYVKNGDLVLDVGCGSGILGMLALKFGAGHSIGTDLDPCALDATHENMEVNGIAKDQYEVMIGNIIDDKDVQDAVGYEKYDIVLANILADVLEPLTPVIVHQMKPGAVYITSGIIEDKETVVTEAVKAAGLEVLEVNHQGEWVSVVARKNA